MAGHEALDDVHDDRVASAEDLPRQVQRAEPTDEDDLAAAESLTGLGTDLSLYTLPTVESDDIEAVRTRSQCDSSIDQRQLPPDVPPPLPHSGTFDQPFQEPQTDCVRYRIRHAIPGLHGFPRWYRPLY